MEIECGDGVENNTINLIVDQGWHGLLVDADEANVATARQFFAMCRDTMVFPPVVTQAIVTADKRERGCRQLRWGY